MNTYLIRGIVCQKLQRELRLVPLFVRLVFFGTQLQKGNLREFFEIWEPKSESETQKRNQAKISEIWEPKSESEIQKRNQAEIFEIWEPKSGSETQKRNQAKLPEIWKPKSESETQKTDPGAVFRDLKTRDLDGLDL